jgi:hypothetical protein
VGRSGTGAGGGKGRGGKSWFRQRGEEGVQVGLEDGDFAGEARRRAKTTKISGRKRIGKKNRGGKMPNSLCQSAVLPKFAVTMPKKGFDADRL